MDEKYQTKILTRGKEQAWLAKREGSNLEVNFSGEIS
jgi:hypothetical protein